MEFFIPAIEDVLRMTPPCPPLSLPMNSRAS